MDENQQICKKDLEGQFHILRDGTWLHEGAPILRLELVKLFSTILQKEPEGGYVLRTPYEVAEVLVDDSPFVVTKMGVEGDGTDLKISFQTNIGQDIVLSCENPLFFKEKVPYIEIKQGITARIITSVYYDLVKYSVEDKNGNYGVWSKNTFFRFEQ